eukprot:3112404-Karenia_brevis.AAC.1
MAFQPHNLECKKRFEEILKEEAKVLNQKARMREFEERERLRREKKDEGKEEGKGYDDTQDKRRRTGPLLGEENRDSGGSSSS